MTRIERPLPEAMEACPTVFALTDTYQIFIPFSREVLLTVRVGEREYYDDANGVFRSKTAIHRVEVPMAELDAARGYTVIYRPMIERTPYFPTSEEPVSVDFPFRPVGTKDPIRILHLADVHNHEEPVIPAAQGCGVDPDLLVLNGDIPNHSDTADNFVTIYRLASRFTGGTIPVVFARGNHDTRGRCAEEFHRYTPTVGGRTYYTFRLGSIWGMVLDCGEDKPDSSIEYGHTVCFHRFREIETEWIRRVIERADEEYNAPDITHKLVICHVPFTYVPEPPFDIEQELYGEWARLLREEIRPDLMLTGHKHRAEVWLPGCPTDHLGQPCPVIVGSKPYKDENGERHFIACGITLEGKRAHVTFCGDEVSQWTEEIE